MRRIQLAVTYLDDTVRYYPVTAGQGWKTSKMYRVSFLVIGTGLPRKMIPLENVQSFDIENIEGSHDGR